LPIINYTPIKIHTTDALKVMRTEKACVLRNESNQCDRQCSACNLVLPSNKILAAYDYVIDMLENKLQQKL
jgi:hypothetical protein